MEKAMAAGQIIVDATSPLHNDYLLLKDAINVRFKNSKLNAEGVGIKRIGDQNLAAAKRSKSGLHLDGVYWASVSHYCYAKVCQIFGYSADTKIRLFGSGQSSYIRYMKICERSDKGFGIGWKSLLIKIISDRCMQKFRHPFLRTLLLETGSKHIYYSTKSDRFLRGDQKILSGHGNLLGRILMGIRSMLRGDKPAVRPNKLLSTKPKSDDDEPVKPKRPQPSARAQAGRIVTLQMGTKIDSSGQELKLSHTTEFSDLFRTVLNRYDGLAKIDESEIVRLVYGPARDFVLSGSVNFSELTKIAREQIERQLLIELLLASNNINDARGYLEEEQINAWRELHPEYSLDMFNDWLAEQRTKQSPLSAFIASDLFKETLAIAVAEIKLDKYQAFLDTLDLSTMNSIPALGETRATIDKWMNEWANKSSQVKAGMMDGDESDDEEINEEQILDEEPELIDEIESDIDVDIELLKKQLDTMVPEGDSDMAYLEEMAEIQNLLTTKTKQIPKQIVLSADQLPPDTIIFTDIAEDHYYFMSTDYEPAQRYYYKQKNTGKLNLFKSLTPIIFAELGSFRHELKWTDGSTYFNYSNDTRVDKFNEFLDLMMSNLLFEAMLAANMDKFYADKFPAAKHALRAIMGVTPSDIDYQGNDAVLAVAALLRTTIDIQVAAPKPILLDVISPLAPVDIPAGILDYLKLKLSETTRIAKLLGGGQITQDSVFYALDLRNSKGLLMASNLTTRHQPPAWFKKEILQLADLKFIDGESLTYLWTYANRIVDMFITHIYLPTEGSNKYKLNAMAVYLRERNIECAKAVANQDIIMIAIKRILFALRSLKLGPDPNTVSQQLVNQIGKIMVSNYTQSAVSPLPPGTQVPPELQDQLEFYSPDNMELILALIFYLFRLADSDQCQAYTQRILAQL